MENHKQCRKCCKILPIAEFYVHAKMSDGHLNICKQCTKVRVTKHRENNIEKIRAYDRIKNAKPEFVQARKKYNEWYRSAKADQRKANQIVGNAIREGALEKCACVICNNPKSEAHHHDYGKPLEVIWLCRIHHMRLHHNKFSLVPPF